MIAIDTETVLIKDRREHVHGTQRVRTEPYETPALVLVSAAGDNWTGAQSMVIGPENGFTQLRIWLEARAPLVFHNAAFDIDVLCTAFPDLWPLFEAALEEGRVHDTMVLDLRARLARGDFAPGVPVRPRSLAACAREYCNLELDKDDSIRLNFGAYLGRVHDLPVRMREYAARDAEATLALHRVLSRVDGHPWDERIELQAAVVYARLDRRGLAIDQSEARRLRALFERDIAPLEAALVGHGLGEWRPVKGTKTNQRVRFQDLPEGLAPDWWLVDGHRGQRWRRFKAHARHETATMEFRLSQNEVRRRLQALVDRTGCEYKRTKKTAALSITADDWRDRVPADAEDLHDWLAHERLNKILTTYLDLYSEVDHAYPRVHVTGTRTGRSSYSNPNVQNVSKRKHGIRSLFVPRPGAVFVRADYGMQELLTLAQAMHDQGIDGPLLAGVRSGRDLHRQTAALLAGCDYNSVSPGQRQGAKAVNFGVPCGLGPIKLRDYARRTYGVLWNPEHAKEMRQRFLASYPDITEYLARCNQDLDAGLRATTGQPLDWWSDYLGCSGWSSWKVRQALLRQYPDVLDTAERRGSVHLRTGFVRAGCRYTEVANTPFQGLAAAVTKRAVWLAERAGLRVVLVVHDEVVIECDPRRAGEAGRNLEGRMKQAFREVCPDVGGFAQVEVSGPLKKWGAATDAQGSAI